MAGINFNAIGTAVGGFLTGYDDAKTRAEKHKRAEMEMAEAQEAQKDAQRKRQAMAGAYKQQQQLGAAGVSRAIGGLQDGSDVSSAMPLPGGAMSSLPGAEQMPSLDSSFGGGSGPVTAADRQQYREPWIQSREGGGQQTIEDYIGSQRGGGGQRAPSYQAAPAGSGFSSGLQNLLQQRGVRTEVAGAPAAYMQRNESGDNPQAINPTSGALGRGQWLGPRKAALTSQYGPHPTDAQQVAFIGQELDGPENRTLAALKSAKTPKEGYDIWGRDFERPGQAALAKAGVGSLAAAVGKMPAAFHQEARQGAQQAAQDIPPDVYGQASIKALVQRIDKAMPGADDATKFMALEYSQKMMAPSEQRQWEMLKEKHHEDFQREMEAIRERAAEKRDIRTEDRAEKRDTRAEDRAEKRDKRTADRQPGTILETDEGPKRIRPGSNTGEPIDIGGAHVIGAKGGERASKNVQVTGEDGKTIFHGSAHQGPGGGWISDKDQTVIDVPDTANIEILGQGGQGRQAAAQMVRLTSGANEARRQIANVAKMTKGTTTSWFQGLQSETGSGLTDGLRRTLANAVTPRDQQMMSVLGRGIGRSLATLETAGAGTGLVALQQSMQQTMPEAGDDVETTLMKIAEMRQIAEQGIESAIAAPALGEKQRVLLEAVRDDIKKAVPWTVPDVIDMVQKPGEESYRSFAAKIGLGQPADAAQSGGVVIQNGMRFNEKTGEYLGQAQ
jgi:tail lysozyme